MAGNPAKGISACENCHGQHAIHPQFPILWTIRALHRPSGRTGHYHVKVQAVGSRLLTTQLYFPNEPANLRVSSNGAGVFKTGGGALMRADEWKQPATRPPPNPPLRPGPRAKACELRPSTAIAAATMNFDFFQIVWLLMLIDLLAYQVRC
jgi:hypothetical protein